jgi:hypothetical protein
MSIDSVLASIVINGLAPLLAIGLLAMMAA